MFRVIITHLQEQLLLIEAVGITTLHLQEQLLRIEAVGITTLQVVIPTASIRSSCS
jgi:hypothetical protein